MTMAEIFLRLAVLGWGVLCGGIVYEHVAVVPQWSKQPPASLAMWSGPYRVMAERFWKAIHPVVILLLAASLAAAWSTDQRSALSVVLGGYLVVIAVTAVWFVPELLKLTQDPDAPIPPDEWRARARRWERLSHARGALVIGLSWPLLGALAGL
jgi:hypothetical protein